MTTTTLVTLTRRFKLGATVLDDPAPHLSPEEALRLYQPNFPHLATARLGEPQVENGTITYPVLKPEIQTKGASKPRGARKPSASVTAALAALDAWEQQPAAPTKGFPEWGAVYAFVEKVTRRPARPLRDAMLIPLA